MILSRNSALVLIVVCVAAILTRATLADDLSDSVGALDAAIQNELAKRPPDNRSNLDENRDESIEMVGWQIRAAIAQNNYSQVDDLLNQIPMLFKSGDVLQAAGRVRAILDNQRAAREKAISTEADAGIEAAVKAVQGAKSASDLDQTIDNLGQLQEQMGGGFSDASRASIEKLRSAREFVMRWQDYIASREAGDAGQARDTLRQLENENDFLIIPRSQIISRINELSNVTPAAATIPETPMQRISDIVGRTKSPDGIPAAIGELSTLNHAPEASDNNWEDPINHEIDDLTAIYQAYSAYQAGAPCQFDFKGNGPQDILKMNYPLRLQVFYIAITRILNVDDSQRPAPGESLGDYLDRMMAKAKQNADAGLIERIEEAKSVLIGKQASPDPLDFATALLAAQNQEIAGQYAPAVISYELALKSGGDLAPAQAIGARLAAIKQAHQQDYDKGMQMFLGNQAQSSPVRYGGAPQAPTSITIPGNVFGSYRPAPSATAAPAPAHPE
ncbi:MAG: hypothetical protein ABSE62_04545 [Chthoniobacteraceae bacterium]